MKEKFLTLNRIESRIHEIAGYRYRDVKSLEFFETKDDVEAKPNPTLPTEFDDTINVSDLWKGRDLYKWLHKKVEIPASFVGKKVVGVFDYGNTGGGNNSGFESLLYVNGKPYQGVDSNHKEVFFLPEHTGTEVDLLFRLWSGLEGGGHPAPQEHKIKRADIAWLDEKVDSLFYYARTILQTINILGEYDYTKENLIKMLDYAFRKIEWLNPGDDVFFDSLYEALDYILVELEKMDKTSIVNVTCIGHTHIDVAWLWRLKHTREKCARSFSTVLRLMEEYPEYIFLQTQPQLYKYIKEDYPEIYEQIKQKVKEKKWEADGGMWVESDCNLISGESLTRQILLGAKFVKDEFGTDVKYLWLPDVFGYSWALPQVLKKSGINTFMTTKISWNQYNRIPHDTFMWKGIDGSEVLTHFITTPDPWCQEGSWTYTYNGQLMPKTVQGSWKAYSEKQLTDELLVSYGFGDGGGGVNRDMLETRRCMDKIPGLPYVKTGTAGEYFDNLHKTVDNHEGYIHKWDGELYLEYHRGTYTSQAYNKYMNRYLEFYYRNTEWLMAMSAIKQGDITLANQDKLNEGWEIILCNQFHDIIPGSSINEVYKDCHVDYDKAHQIAIELTNEALEHYKVADNDNMYTVVNNSNWTATQLISITESRDGVFKLNDGTVLSADKKDDVWYVEVKNLKPMSFTNITFEEQATSIASLNNFTMGTKSIETPFYKIELNEFGQFSSIYDKQNDMEVLAEGQLGNVLQMFEDKPLAHEAWDIDMFYQLNQDIVSDLQSIEVIENTNLRAIIQMVYKYNKTTIKQDVIFYANNRRIDFKTFVDYRERKRLLKVAFPVNVRSTYATYDIQYGNVKRANHWNTSWDWAKFETVAHKWVDMSEKHYGVSLLNDCKYGHDIKENVMRLTLLKSATHPDIEQDQGEHNFTYSLLPHSGDFVDAEVERESYALNQPVAVMSGQYEETNFITLSNDEVMLDAVKRTEDGEYLLIRIHDFAGAKQNVKVKLNAEYQYYVEGDLRERPVSDKQTGDIELSLTPYEVKTILVKI